MRTVREELFPGVWLTALKTNKFKTGALTLSVLTQLTSETAFMNALLPNVLRRGTSAHPDMRSIAKYCESLYGTSASGAVRTSGEIQCSGFALSFPEGRYVPEGDTLRDAAALLGELLLTPNTRGGLLLPDYVSGEKEKLTERIRSRRNNKGSYAVRRLIENMCAYESYAVGALGSEDDADGVEYVRLSKHYRQWLASSPIELFYCGGEEAEAVSAALRDALSALPRGEIDYDIGTDVRMNSVEEKPREFTEHFDVNQGRLAIGWRLGDCMEEPDEAAIAVFNELFGGGVTSKLFRNVRERLSLCYYASSLVDTEKGILVAHSGVEFDKLDAARDEIFAQLESIARGDFTEAELGAAKKAVASAYLSAGDSTGSLEGRALRNAISGTDVSFEDLSALAEDVTGETVAQIAKGVECDAIYYMLGGGEAEDE